MKCQTCNAVIPPEWKSAISSNLCPACGDKIYNTDVAELICGLADALSKMPNDAVAIAGWMVSNYEIRKIGDAKPVEEFYGKKVKNEQSTNDLTKNKFLKNTTVFKDIKKTNEKIAAMAQAISGLDVDEEMYGDGSSEIAVEESVDDEELPPQKPVKRMSEILATNQMLTDPKEDVSEEEIVEIMQTVANSGPLTLDKFKRIQSQEKFNEGRGLFKRS